MIGGVDGVIYQIAGRGARFDQSHDKVDCSDQSNQLSVRVCWSKRQRPTKTGHRVSSPLIIMPAAVPAQRNRSL